MLGKRISKKECADARQRAACLLDKVRLELRDKYVFDKRLVGSRKWGTMIEDEEGKYDLDYQILLTKRSKEFTNNGLQNPTKINADFLGAFTKLAKEDEKVENSTSAITFMNRKGSDKPYSIDFVIIKLCPVNEEIIRRNNKKGDPQSNQYTWNELPKWNDAYKKFKKLPPKQKKDLIDNVIIPNKIKEKKKRKDDPNRMSSADIFVRDVNDYDPSKR